jgi:hypothetical protein
VLAVSLGELHRLAGTLPQIIQFGPSRLSAADGLDVDNIGRMQRKDSLDTLVVDDSSHRKGLVYAPPFSRNHRAGEYLHPLLLALSDSAVNIDGIAYFKMRDFLLEAIALNRI